MSIALPPLLCLAGPTGSGKSELALRLCERFHGEIVSSDALQVYRGLDIGTAKLALEDRRGIRHHLIDVIEPTEGFSAADFVALAVPAIADIVRRGRIPVVVGGTGLYLRALLKGLFAGPGRSESVRARLAAITSRRGTATLHRLLKRWDPASAERIHPNDVVRVVRALEVRIQAGRPMSELMSKRESPVRGFHVILVGLEPDRAELAARIRARAQAMMDRGLVREVRGLLSCHGAAAPAFKAIGYHEIRRYLASEIDLGTATDLMVTATTQYAKRQLTWFRREEGIVWFSGHGGDPVTFDAVSAFVEGEFDRQRLETVHAETAP